MKSFNIRYQIYSRIVSTLFALFSQMKIESCFSSSTGLILLNRMRNRMSNFFINKIVRYFTDELFTNLHCVGFASNHWNQLSIWMELCHNSAQSWLVSQRDIFILPFQNRQLSRNLHCWNLKKLAGQFASSFTLGIEGWSGSGSGVFLRVLPQVDDGTAPQWLPARRCNHVHHHCGLGRHIHRHRTWTKTILPKKGFSKLSFSFKKPLLEKWLISCHFQYRQR